ncbi:MAG: DNA-3-methyladenine glycosylase 2 family protein [Candidatus Parcubacteria bacterium]|nr:DNA-3-methyladenine glycosylase 2 family protein [Burkholderiales bacterium]
MKPDVKVKPDYWDRAKRSLMRRDPLMAAIIRGHPRVHLEPRGEPFHTLARAIVGQQISVAAAQSVWNRFSALVSVVSHERILRANAADLRACGLSGRKCEYICDLAQRFDDGKVQVHHWPEMSDEAVIEDLVQVRGIGRWTAEMFLMFNLLRPDVFPLDDLGLRKGIQLGYFKRPVSLKTMRRLGETWRPWRSVATWYLWRSLDPVPVEY